MSLFVCLISGTCVCLLLSAALSAHLSCSTCASVRAQVQQATCSVGRIIPRQLIWYIALIGAVEGPLLPSIVAELKPKPSSSFWLAGLITLIKHRFDRIIFIHLPLSVCLSLFPFPSLSPVICNCSKCFQLVLSSTDLAPCLIPVSQEQRA